MTKKIVLKNNEVSNCGEVTLYAGSNKVDSLNLRGDDIIVKLGVFEFEVKVWEIKCEPLDNLHCSWEDL